MPSHPRDSVLDRSCGMQSVEALSSFTFYGLRTYATAVMKPYTASLDMHWACTFAARTHAGKQADRFKPTAVWCNGVDVPQPRGIRATRRYRRWAIMLPSTPSPCATVALHFRGFAAPLQAAMCAMQGRSTHARGTHRTAGAAKTHTLPVPMSLAPVHTSACAPVFLSPYSNKVSAATVDMALEWVEHMLGQVGRVHLHACNMHDTIATAVWRHFNLTHEPELRDRIIIKKWNWVERYAGRYGVVGWTNSSAFLQPFFSLSSAFLPTLFFSSGRFGSQVCSSVQIT